jgi:hypothetical protein
MVPRTEDSTGVVTGSGLGTIVLGLQGGLNDGASSWEVDDSVGSGEVDDGMGSGEIFDRKFWHLGGVGENV